MVANGVHILVSMALILLLFRAERPEPYLVAALAATFPDIDTIVFRPLLRVGYVHGPVWAHRGLTHSLLAGGVLVLLLSLFGPWRAASVGFLSHVFLDSLTGGVQLFAPVDPGLYGLSISWLELNVATAAVSVTAILVGLRWLKHESGPDESGGFRIPGAPRANDEEAE